MRCFRPGIALLLALSLTTAPGCAGPQRRPQPAAPAKPVAPTPGMQQGAVQYPSPRAGSAYDDPSTGIATVAAAVPGAGPVRAVVLGNVVLIGTASPDPVIHGRIAQQIRSSFHHIADVRFTSNPAQIDRLGTALSLIQTHRSIANMLPELWGIGNALPSHR